MRILRNLIFLLISCFATITNAQVITKAFADDTSAIEFEFEGEIIGKDTIKNGRFKRFFEYSKGIFEEGNYAHNKKEGLFTTYYENGEKHWVRAYQLDRLIGKEEFYSSTGELLFTGEYLIINENKGKYNAFYPSGKLKETANLSFNSYDGTAFQFSENGDTLSKFQYENGVLNGGFWIKNESNVLVQKGNYDRAKLTDTVRSYYQNGEIKSVGNFSNGMPNGEMRDYYLSGQLKRKCYYHLDTLTGNCKTYYENGQLATNVTFFKGHFDGLFLEYFENGNLKDSINYTRSQKNGESKHMDENGNLLSIENFKNGIYNGHQLSYHLNGKIRRDFNYKDGHKTGENYSYFEDGTIESILIFNSKDFIIAQKENYPSGKLKTKTTHKYKKDTNNPGKWIHYATEKSYDSQGKISSLGKYVDDKKEGKWKYYYSNGKTWKLESYKADKLHGDYKEFHINNKIKTQGTYISGKKSGVWTKFATSGDLISKSIYKNDYLDGAFYEKLETGEEISGFYKKGLKEGIWITTKDGKEISKTNYLKGVITTK